MLCACMCRVHTHLCLSVHVFKAGSLVCMYTYMHACVVIHNIYCFCTVYGTFIHLVKADMLSS